MVFSSATFLLLFLPLSVVLYYLMPGRAAKNGWLFAVSLVFYAWGEPVYIWLMLVSVVGNWLFGIALGSAGSRGRRRALLVCDLVLNLALLGFFKYEGFLADNINALVGSTVVPDLELALPIGISFYTLQAVSYIIDVYRGEVAPQRNVVYLGMYIACFPQLVAGPIVKYSDIELQLSNRRISRAKFGQGIERLLFGLSKKVLLANNLGLLYETIQASGSRSIMTSWLGIFAYTLQIYFDFSGYSDMAIGMGKMLGFTFPENFNFPYISDSITDLSAVSQQVAASTGSTLSISASNMDALHRLNESLNAIETISKKMFALIESSDDLNDSADDITDAQTSETKETVSE